MIPTITITGVSELMTKLQVAATSSGPALESALKKGGLLVQAASQKEVPVDQGNLKNSAFTRAHFGQFVKEVRVGYTAGYAVYVHENVDAAHGSAYNAKYADEIARGLKGYHNKGANQKAKFLIDPANKLAGVIQWLIAGAIQGTLSAITKGAPTK
jgi:hypothetical protein